MSSRPGGSHHSHHDMFGGLAVDASNEVGSGRVLRSGGEKAETVECMLVKSIAIADDRALGSLAAAAPAGSDRRVNGGWRRVIGWSAESDLLCLQYSRERTKTMYKFGDFLACAS